MSKPCPECGGTDRFYRIDHPHDGGDPYWRCRMCDYTEPDDESDDLTAPATFTPKLTPDELATIYMAYAWFAQACARSLWTPEGRAALAYLRQRGLHDATIRAAGLGWCGDGMAVFARMWYESSNGDLLVAATDPRNLYYAAKAGGLWYRQARPFRVARGTITIPYYHAGRCVFVRGRKLAPKPGEAKYYSPKGPAFAGGLPAFYGTDILREHAGPVIVTEGELKALAAVQAWRAGGVRYPTIATPGIGYLPEPLVQALAGRVVFLCYDNEPPKAGSTETPAERWIPRHAARLRAVGCVVRTITLPRQPGEGKIDLDSYLLALAHERRAA